MKKVALIQSEITFTPELKKKYLDCIPLLTSSNINTIYKFIKKNTNNKNIYKYVLYLNSNVISDLIDFLYIKKKNSQKAKKMLSKCILVATLSNADIVRQKNIEKKTNIYFSLSPISDVLSAFNGIPPNRLMLVVSDTVSPYYEQIYNINVTPKYKLSELTVEKINQFVLTGSNITMSLNTLEEYEKITQLILQSNYTRQLSVIEIEYVDLLRPLFNKLSSITTSSSGVALCGNINIYNDLNKYLPYQNNALMLIYFYNEWENFIKRNIISIKSPTYNISVVYDIKSS